MYTLLQSKRVRGAAGEPLPRVFGQIDAEFRRGQLALVAAGPGTGKSAFTLTLAMKARVPTFIFSADSDAHTQLTRALCVATGCTMAEADQKVRADELGSLEAKLSDSMVRLAYDASPSLDTIELELEAYQELYGEYPHLIIVDNVTNVRVGTVDDDDPFSGLEGLMDYLHTMARSTQACVIGLHHVVGKYNDAAEPIPLSGLKNQIGRVPELVLTMYRAEVNKIGVSTVKNRAGKADPSGWNPALLSFDATRMRIE